MCSSVILQCYVDASIILLDVVRVDALKDLFVLITILNSLIQLIFFCLGASTNFHPFFEAVLEFFDKSGRTE